jgi:hypothetical protein
VQKIATGGRAFSDQVLDAPHEATCHWRRLFAVTDCSRLGRFRSDCNSANLICLAGHGAMGPASGLCVYWDQMCSGGESIPRRLHWGSEAEGALLEHHGRVTFARTALTLRVTAKHERSEFRSRCLGTRFKTRPIFPYETRGGAIGPSHTEYDFAEKGREAGSRSPTRTDYQHDAVWVPCFSQVPRSAVALCPGLAHIFHHDELQSALSLLPILGA